MLEESKESRSNFFSAETSAGFHNDGSPPPLLEPGVVHARITGVRKLVTNYESYIAYQIETVANRKDYPSQIRVVERRYREFDWLHSRFLSIYVVLFVPPLPGKKILTQFNRLDSSFVDQRCSGLQTFLRKSASHPVLSGNPDFIAFLTYSQNDFQTHMQRNPVESTLLSSFIGQPDLNLPGGNLTEKGLEQQSAEVVGTNSPDLQSSSLLVDGTAGKEMANSTQLLQASEKFACYQTELMEYTALCQHLSSVMSRMTSQLTTLSYDQAEFAKALEGAGVSTSAAEGRWASAIVGSAVRQTAQLSQALASRFSVGPANAWHENAAFGEAVKGVLRNRQTIQDSYFSLDEEIKERQRADEALTEHESHPQSTSATAGSNHSNLSSQPFLARLRNLSWSSYAKKKKNRPMSELQSEISSAYQDLIFANSQIDAEWHRWELSRAVETAESLTALTSGYVAYWSSLVDMWRDVSTRLASAPPSYTESQTETADDNKIPEGESAQVVTTESLLKSNSVESTPSTKGSRLDEVDLSASSKEAEDDTEGEKERGWMVVDLSNSPSIEHKTEGAPSSASSMNEGD